MSWVLVIISVGVFASPAFSAITRETGITRENLWRSHAEYQVFAHGDYVTPLVLKAMLGEIRKNPHIDYDSLVQYAATAQKEYLESKQYAETGRLPDPFETEKAVAEWAKDASKYTENPLIAGLADIGSLTFQFGTGLTGVLTTLDDKQSLLLRDVLRTSAYKDLDGTFSDIQKVGKQKSRAKASFNTVMQSSLGITTDDSEDDIKKKSPALVAAVNTQQVLATQLTPSDVDRIIKDNLKDIKEQNEQAFGELVQIRKDVGSLVDAQQRATEREKSLAKLQKQEEIAALKIDAAHSVVYLFTALMSDQVAAQKIQIIAESMIRSYEAVERYTKTIQKLGDGASGYAEIVLMGSEVGIALSIASAFAPQQDASQVILEQLNSISKMIAELYDLVNSRFDRLEIILDSYQRTNIQGLRALLVQGAITEDRVEQIRESMLRESQRIEDVSNQVQQGFRAERNLQFLQLEHKCYGDKVQGIDITEIGVKGFNDCLRMFAGIAIDTSAMSPFADLPPPNWTLGQVSAHIHDPFENLNFLARASSGFGSSFVPLPQGLGNPTVWSNASIDLLATIGAWPEHKGQVSGKRLSTLIERGEEIQRGISSMFSVPTKCPQRAACSPPYDQFGVFKELIEQHENRLGVAGQVFRKLADTYAVKNLHGVNPFEYRLKSAAGIAGPDDPDFASLLPSRMSYCSGTTLGGFVEFDKPGVDIPLPKEITKLIDPYFKVAERIDPPNHSLSFCYQIRHQDFRYYNYRWTDLNGRRDLNFVYVATPVLDVITAGADGLGQKISVTLPPMSWGASLSIPTAEWRFVREYDDTNPPDELKAFEHLYPRSFYDWWEKNAASSFGSQASVKLVAAHGKDGVKGWIDYTSLRRFVAEELTKQEWEIAQQVFLPEFAKEGDLSRIMNELDGIKTLIQAYTIVAFPRTMQVDTELQRFTFGDKQIYDSGLIRASLNEQVAQHSNIAMQLTKTVQAAADALGKTGGKPVDSDATHPGPATPGPQSTEQPDYFLALQRGEFGLKGMVPELLATSSKFVVGTNGWLDADFYNFMGSTCWTKSPPEVDPTLADTLLILKSAYHEFGRPVAAKRVRPPVQ